ncbi:MAG: phage holin family protein [Prevotella sp.]|uniref:phage holin family protein n=1 Tax=Prevotella sp. TaxID=59823 RepID=UPI002A299BE0|nr:phage holin family protein [Prevotella sp.]MDD7318700.1 phage holin family protein [Prevotellaceae bacterium]MDY4019343.1 phage holin family protein [Prevotella sp.]
MFSSDRNIETIGQLVEVLKHYVGLQTEYVKLDVIDKTVRLITVLVIGAVTSLVMLLMLIYLSFAAAFALSTAIGYPLAFCVVAAFYLTVLILLYLLRKPVIERPLVKFLAGLLFDNETNKDI